MGDLPTSVADSGPAISDTEKGAASHTPGPWELRVVPHEGWVWICPVTATYHHEEICTIYGASSGEAWSPISMANAHLITAAPDMLDALKQWKWAQDNRDAVEIVNAQISRDLAIAKAEGRS
jgi:hypothetical protein